MLPVLFGALAGKSLAEIALSRTVLLMGVWILFPWIASMAALNHIHAPWAGYAAGLSTMAAMLAFASTPRPGPVRLALLLGLSLWCPLALAVALLRLTFHVIGAGFVAGVAGEIRWVGIGTAAVALSGYARWRIDAAIRRQAV